MTMQQPPNVGDFAAEPRSIDLRDYWLAVRRHWLLILVLTALGVVLAGGYAHTMAPTYSATAQVLFKGITADPGEPASQTNVPVNMSTQQSVAQGTDVVDAAAQILKVPPSILQAEVAKNLTVTVPATTLTTSNVLQITWKAKSPLASQAGADAFATASLAGWRRGLVAQVASLQTSLNKNLASLANQIGHVSAELSKTSPTDSAHTSLEISLNELTGLQSTASKELEQTKTYNTGGGSVIQAALPTTSSGISHKVIIAVGGLLGLLLGLVLAFLWDSFDDRVHGSAQFERALGSPVLAVLPLGRNRTGGGKNSSQRWLETVATVASPSSQSAEGARALRAALVTVAAHKNLNTFLVVSLDPMVTSGHVVCELGVALAESGRRVLLVGADMRSSVMPQVFDLPNKVGLSDLLTGGGDPEILIYQPKEAGGITMPSGVVQRLRVLPPGGQIAHTLSVIDSDAMLSLLQHQCQAHEFVVLDSPPTNVAADAFALAGHVDGVIVIASRRVKGRAVNDLHRRLDQVDARLIGGVFVVKAKNGQRRRPADPEPVSSSSIASPSIADPEPSESRSDETSKATATDEPEAESDQTVSFPSTNMPDASPGRSGARTSASTGSRQRARRR